MDKMTITFTMDQIAKAVENFINTKVCSEGWQVEDWQTFPAKGPREIKYYLVKTSSVLKGVNVCFQEGESHVCLLDL